MTEVTNKTEEELKEEKIKLFKTIIYPRLVSELNSNNKLISEYNSFKSSVSALISNIESFKTNLESTYNSTLNAISFDGFSTSIEKINNYAKTAASSISALQSVVSEVKTEVEKLEQRNSEIRTQINA